MNLILCPTCVRLVHPNGWEEKSCTHGCFEATCTRCGKNRAPEDAFWSCFGSVGFETDLPENLPVTLLLA